MRQVIDYNKYNDPMQKQDAAIADLKAYFGLKKFKEIESAVKAEPIGRLYFVDMLGLIAGVEGYPAQAWADRLGIPAYTEEELFKINSKDEAVAMASGEAD